MKPSDSEWQRLTAAARRIQGETTETSAPLGFAARIVARSLSAPRAERPDALARLSWPALGVAALIMAVTVATNLKPLLTTVAENAAALSEPIEDVGDSSL